MTTVFIAGSMTIKNLDHRVKERIANVIALDYDVVVGDADGVDCSIQQLLKESGANKATVYCAGDRPRNNVGHWPVHCVTTYHSPGSRAYFTAKDIEMAKDADYGLMIWDAKSPGTLSNVIELLTLKKNALVFINKEKEFKKVVDVTGLDELLSVMSDHAKTKADAKIQLFDRISGLRSRERQREILARSSANALAERAASATCAGAPPANDKAID
jgi:hypothetical protein